MSIRTVSAAMAFLIAACAAGTASAQATGTVVDPQGRPIAGVVVNAQLQEVVKTAADGTFHLKGPTLMVRVFKAGFRPSIRLIDSPDTRIQLEVEKTTPTVLPVCPGTDRDRTDVGNLQLPTPKGMARQHMSDDDYGMTNRKYRRAWLRHGSGPMWSYGYPRAEDLRGLRNLIERDVRLPIALQNDADALGDEHLVLDIRGTRPNGRRFRFVGIFGETIEYDDATPAEAAVFDRILDGMCYARPPVP